MNAGEYLLLFVLIVAVACTGRLAETAADRDRHDRSRHRDLMRELRRLED